MTQVLAVDPLHPDEEALRRAAAVLRSGGLAAFPTETVYGLGANALDEKAVRRIFHAKGRPSENPIIVHVADIEQARRLVAEWPDKADRLARRFWPGPLTLVLPGADCVPSLVTAGGPTVGIRIPAHPVALGLLRAAGIALAAPSANRSTELSPTRAEHVLAGLEGRIDLLLDGGPCALGLESTVLDVSREPPRLLRPGLISRAELEAEIGAIVVGGGERGEGPLASPGLLEKHYSPRTPLEVTADVWGRMEEYRRRGLAAVCLAFQKPQEMELAARVVVMPRDARAYAGRMYAVLHEVDRRGVERIVVEAPPEGWVAIWDRLRRAADAG